MGLRFSIAIRNKRCNSLTSRSVRAQYAGGQTLAEYALILAFISVVAIASLMSLGGQVSSVYTSVNRQLNTASNGGTSTAARGH
jgi:Flp pilus assembly pilin Flp